MSNAGPSVATWCDGTPHSPKAIPPLPLHDLRWDGDDPYTKCARCGQITDHLGNVLVTGRTVEKGSEKQHRPFPANWIAQHCITCFRPWPCPDAKSS